MKYSLSILFFILTIAVYGQPGDLPVNKKPGACYAKCLMPSVDFTTEFYSEIKEYPVYIGDTPEKVKAKMVSIEIKPPIHLWVKKLRDNCKPNNENDCLVWCLIEEAPAEYMNLEVVKNKRKLKDEDWVYKEVEVFVTEFDVPPAPGSSTQWKEILCKSKVSELFITDLKNKLSAEGFEQDLANQTFDAKLKSALTTYQKENELPVGQLDVETLEALGLGYYF